jgi:predicted DCC family thiol-disulfide oxidoreductase YuxK
MFTIKACLVALRKVHEMRSATLVLYNGSCGLCHGLRVLPIALLDQAYDLIARNRYRILGRRDRCLAPRPEYKRRFLDSVGDVVQKPEVLE